MNTLINNIAKVIAVPAGKKFSTIAIMEDGTEITLKAKGVYKPLVNIFNGIVNLNVHPSTLGAYVTYNNKVVTKSFWLNDGEAWVTSFPVELAA